MSGDLERLLAEAGAQRRLAAPGERLFAEGDPADAAFFIRSGAVEIVTQGPGKDRRLLNRLDEGELFGEMALLDRTRRSASAVASGATELLVLPREQFLALLQREPRVNLWMLDQSSRRLRVLTRMVAQMEELHEANRRVLIGRELERRRIGLDMHDNVAQLVAGLMMLNRAAIQHLDRDPQKLRSILERQDAGLREALEAIRGITGNLFPKALSQGGLIAAIEQLLDRTVRSHGISVLFEHAGIDEALPTGLATTLFCIVQEAISNLTKHARASEARIDLGCDGRCVDLEIQDNGQGFDPIRQRDEQAGDDTYGLLSMRERTKMAGGIMEIASRPGAGTRLRFTIPVRPDLQLSE